MSADNSPAIHGWEKCPFKLMSPVRDERTWSAVPDGTWLVGWTPYPAINGWAIFNRHSHQLLRNLFVQDFLHRQGDDDFAGTLEEGVDLPQRVFGVTGAEEQLD